MKKLPSLKDYDLKNQTILVRVDYNVPIKQGKIQDPTRIDETLPTLNFLIQSNCRIILMSHLGSPKGKKDPSLSLKPISDYLAKKLGQTVNFIEDCLDPSIPKKVADSSPGSIFLLENLRYYKAEEEPILDPNFSKTLASYANYFVNDAFGCAHRCHASTYEICKLFPKRSMLGFLMMKEVESLSGFYQPKKKPVLAILGGAKIESKIQVIESLLDKVNAIAIGGGMSIPFLNAKGYTFYSHLCTPESILSAKKILDMALKMSKQIFLPIDVVISDLEHPIQLYNPVDITEGSTKPETPVDIGPKTISYFKSLISHYQTIFWNGPLGIFEIEPFSIGTYEIAKSLAGCKKITIAGGGDSVSAIQKAGLKNKFTHVSTGGGASLEFIEKGSLPGIDAIIEANS